MGAMSPMHWLIVLGVLVLLFGAKKLPDMARSIGQSARVFKGEMKDLKADDNTADATEPPAVTAATPATSVTPATPATSTSAAEATPTAPAHPGR